MPQQTELFGQSPTGTYFNTNDLRGEQLKEARAKVTGQSLEILNVFAFNPQVEFTPWEINERTNSDYPITSIRRAISTLEKQGYLVKTVNTKESGPYRAQSFTWKLNPKNMK